MKNFGKIALFKENIIFSRRWSQLFLSQSFVFYRTLVLYIFYGYYYKSISPISTLLLKSFLHLIIALYIKIKSLLYCMPFIKIYNLDVVFGKLLIAKEWVNILKFKYIIDWYFVFRLKIDHTNYYDFNLQANNISTYDISRMILILQSVGTFLY